MATVTRAPAVLEAMLPLTVLLNCVRLTWGSGSGDAVWVVRWTQPADWQSNYDTPSRKIAPGTIAFQSHDTFSVTAYSNIRIKLLN